MFNEKIKEHKKTTAILAGLGLCAGCIFAVDVYLTNSPLILPKVRIAHVDVGQYSSDQAVKSLQTMFQETMPWQIILTDQRDVWTLQPKDINLEIDSAATVANAYALGRETTFFERWSSRFSVWREGRTIPLAIRYDRDRLTKTVSLLAPQINRNARNASILPQEKDVALIPSVEGRKVNSSKTVEMAFNSPQTHVSFVIELQFDRESPKISDSHFAGITKVLSSYATRFNPWDSERNENIRLAASRIHGTILKPGETFSYNTIVGHRTQAEGFRMAPVILDGKLVPDWGGGVCQVSSTLYNAVLLADMDIVDRSNHGRAIGYVPLGFDATVVDNQIDFKFRNSAKHPIYLYANITYNEMQFLFLGSESDLPPPIELEYNVLRVYEPIEVKQPDPSLDAGKEVIDEPPQRGFRVSTWRIRKIDGKEIRQHLFTDDYDPVNKIIKIGTKGSPTPAVTDTKTTTTSPPSNSSVPPTATTPNATRITLTR